jgi:hypothetical protein
MISMVLNHPSASAGGGSSSSTCGGTSSSIAWEGAASSACSLPARPCAFGEDMDAVSVMTPHSTVQVAKKHTHHLLRTTLVALRTVWVISARPHKFSAVLARTTAHCRMCEVRAGGFHGHLH